MDQAASETFADRPFSFCEYDRVALWEIDTKLMEHHARLRRLSEQVQALSRSVLVVSGPAQMRQDCAPQPSLQSEVELFQATYVLNQMVSMQFDLIAGSFPAPRRCSGMVPNGKGNITTGLSRAATSSVAIVGSSQGAPEGTP